MQKIVPESVARSGFKYWLEPDGTLYQTTEHSVGAMWWALQNMDDPRSIFGVRDLMALGWLRLVTDRNYIRVTGGSNANNPVPTEGQDGTIKRLADRFKELNGIKPAVAMGEDA